MVIKKGITVETMLSIIMKNSIFDLVEFLGLPPLNCIENSSARKTWHHERLWWAVRAKDSVNDTVVKIVIWIDERYTWSTQGDIWNIILKKYQNENRISSQFHK